MHFQPEGQEMIARAPLHQQYSFVSANLSLLHHAHLRSGGPVAPGREAMGSGRQMPNSLLHGEIDIDGRVIVSGVDFLLFCLAERDLQADQDNQQQEDAHDGLHDEERLR